MGVGVSTTGLGLLFEENRTEIVAAWKQAVERELRTSEPALAFAVAPLLRELALAVEGSRPERAREGPSRCAVLVRSTATAAQIAREFSLLRRCAWDALRLRGTTVLARERRAADDWLGEALAEALERLERVRQRAAALDPRTPIIVPALPRRPSPPPLPRRGQAPPAPPSSGAAEPGGR